MDKIKFFLLFFVLFGMFEFIPNTDLLCSAGELKVGVAKIDITPPVGIKLRGGYGKRDTLPSQGLIDPLYIRILVLDVNGYRVGIMACDLIGYSNKNILDIAKERFNISHLLICSAHLHSGPNLDAEDSQSYARSLEKNMIDGLDRALKNMFPARISAGSAAFPQLGFNRLVMRDDGHARALFRTEDRIPYGPVDPEAGVIKIEDMNGNPRVILMTYACHPVVNFVNYEISADYPGAATKKVEDEFGKNTVCMFVQGGGANIDPLFMNLPRNGPNDTVKTDYGLKEKMGGILANEVIKVVKSLQRPSDGETTLKAMCDSLKFTGRFDKTINYNMHFTTILINNSIAIATMFSEPFVQHQLYWKEHAEVAHPFFFGYTYSSGGNYPGYVPDIKSAAYGGYGADDNIKRIEVGAGEAVMNKQLENLYRLREVMRNSPGPP